MLSPDPARLSPHASSRCHRLPDVLLTRGCRPRRPRGEADALSCGTRPSRDEILG